MKKEMHNIYIINTTPYEVKVLGKAGMYILCMYVCATSHLLLIIMYTNPFMTPT